MTFTAWIVVFAALILFAALDMQFRSINNFLIVPAILAFAAVNGSFLQAGMIYAIATMIGLYDFELGRFLNDEDCDRYSAGLTKTLFMGGDAKLMAFVGAAVSDWRFSVLAVLISWGLVFVFRRLFRYAAALPYAPFLLVSYVAVVR